MKVAVWRQGMRKARGITLYNGFGGFIEQLKDNAVIIDSYKVMVHDTVPQQVPHISIAKPFGTVLRQRARTANH